MHLMTWRRSIELALLLSQKLCPIQILSGDIQEQWVCFLKCKEFLHQQTDVKLHIGEDA